MGLHSTLVTHPDVRSQTANALTFGILGPLRADEKGRPVPLGPFKQRIVLALLLCHANRIVPVSTLSDALWDGDPPRTAHKNIQVYVSALRKLLGSDRHGDRTAGVDLRFSPPGYELGVGPDQLDALRFRALARSGRAAARTGDNAGAVDLLERALRLWRGPVLADLVSVPVVAAEAERLDEQHLGTYEDWVEVKLALGQHTDLIDGIDDMARRHPFRERVRHAQMLALYRSGRQTEALAQFDAMRQLLARDLGLRPSPVLTRLYESILSGDPGLDTHTPSRIGPVGVRVTAAGRSRLARDIADFTGREPYVDALLDLLGSVRPGGTAAISGSAGVGKTTLAMRCAHRLGGHFPDGRILVCLRDPDGQPRTVGDTLGDLLRATGWTAELPDGDDVRAALLRGSVAGRRMLFILDDAVSEEHIRAVLAAAGDVVVLVTSRRHLAGLDTAVYITLGPMTEAEAMDLLGRLVGRDRLAVEPEAARRLVAICGGLPLALRIVGAKLAGLGHLTLARYAERLEDERRMLDELTAGDVQIRSRLAVAYRDLEPDERATLHCLAALPADRLTASEVAGALGTDPAGAEAAVERLMGAHLVQAHNMEVQAHAGRGEARYRLSTLVGTYVREVAAGSSVM